MKTLVIFLSIFLACIGCQYEGDTIIYYLDGGVGDAGVMLDGGGGDTDSDTATDTDTEELDAGSDAGGLGCVEGDYSVSNSMDIDLLAPYSCITGELRIQAPGLAVIDISHLDWIGGDLHVVGNNDATLITLSSLSSVGGSLRITYNPLLENYDLSSLTSVIEEVFFYQNMNLPDCNACTLLSQLTSAPFSVGVYSNLDDSCTPVPTGCP